MINPECVAFGNLTSDGVVSYSYRVDDSTSRWTNRMIERDQMQRNDMERRNRKNLTSSNVHSLPYIPFPAVLPSSRRADSVDDDRTIAELKGDLAEVEW